MTVLTPRTLEDAQEILRLYEESESNASKLAQAIEKPAPTVRRWVQMAKKIVSNKGYDVPQTHFVKGYSTLYDGDGNIKQEWVKTDIEKQDAYEAIREAVENLTDEMPREKTVKLPKINNNDLASCYVLTDYHLGQLSWGDECGEDWDMEIAYELINNWFGSAIKSAPNSHTGVLCQLGDFLHWDGMEAVTPSSGHVLDADSRFPKLVDLSIKALRIIIKMMLEKHKHVHVVLAEGNHDMSSSIWLRSLFSALFENEPRVTIDNTHSPFYCFEWGLTSLFFHHGHKKRIGQISNVFAGKYREVFGRTKYSYGHMGHMHHIDVKEDQLMVIEQHPTLSAKDAHSARGGYASKRAANVVTYSKKYGEVSRMTIRPEMVM